MANWRLILSLSVFSVLTGECILFGIASERHP